MEALNLFGHYDEHLRQIEGNFDVSIATRGNEVVIVGPEKEVDRAVVVFNRLISISRQGGKIDQEDVQYAIKAAKNGEDISQESFGDFIIITSRGKQVRPKTLGQKQYVEAIKSSGIVFGIGPAGTGKTYLAVAMAIASYRSREVNRIVLTRPAVEAGEKLGFLPGDLQEKVNPYLRPLYDALYDFLGVDTFEKYMSRGIIEVAPLAYMRGRTLDDSFVILDEAQNTTSEQMKMFLTRLGLGSKAVVTGDITQIDLPRGRSSGLEEVRVILTGIEGIKFVYLTELDVVRHELVTEIIKAYERYEKEHKKTELRDDEL